MKVNKVVLLLSNTSWYLYNFKKDLIDQLIQTGYKIILVAPFDKHTKEFENRGIKVINWHLNRKSLNPLSALCSIIQLVYVYAKIKPDLVHHFTIKSIVYGTIAARIINIKTVINAFTGLGPVYFMREKHLAILKNFILALYKAVLSEKRCITIVQNKSDLNELELLSKRNISKSILIPGSGVDTEFFDIEEKRQKFNNPPKILFPARLIQEKGFNELLEACNLLWDENYLFKLIVAGLIDFGNNSCISENYLRRIQLNKNISFLGHVNNMKYIYESVDIVALPSWREGLSKSLIEASSMQCAIVTTNVAGCNDVINHLENGLLVPAKDVKALKQSIEYLLNNQEFALKLGAEARKNAISKFKLSKINKLTLDLYEDIFRKNL